MAIQMGKSLAFTAVSGIVAGLVGCGGSTPPAEAPAAGGAEPAKAGGDTAAPATAAPAGDKHACKGQNDCKGKGGCKNEKNDCKGKNECKGKGGCKME